MPRLTDVHFSVRGPAGGYLSFASRCDVSTKGLFTLEIPEQLRLLAQQTAKDEGSAAAVAVGPSSVSGTELEKLKAFIQRLAKEFLEGQTKVELVIRYNTNLRVAFYIAGSPPKVHPNGVNQLGGNWWEPSRGESLCGTSAADSYSVGFAAAAYFKVTIETPKRRTVEYHKARAHSHLGNNPLPNPPEAAVALNQFVGLDLSEAAGEIPYSDAAATQFRQWMLTLCVLARGIDAAFSSGESLQRLLESSTPLLPAP
jgi:hypothetical protein